MALFIHYSYTGLFCVRGGSSRATASPGPAEYRIPRDSLMVKNANTELFLYDLL